MELLYVVINFTYLTNLQVNNHFVIPMDVMCKKEEQFSRVTTIQPECVYSVPVILAHRAALYLRPAGFGSVFDYLFYHNCQLLAYVFAFSLVASWICSDELKRTEYNYLSANITFKNKKKLSIYIYIYIFFFFHFVGMLFLLCSKIYPMAISRQDVVVVHDITACQENVLFDQLF